MIVRRLTRQMLCQPFLLIFAFGWSMETTIRWHVGEEKLGDMCIFKEGKAGFFAEKQYLCGGKREGMVGIVDK